MVVASIILLIESVGVFFNEGYAISVAVIAMLLALGALVMTYKMQDKWNSMGKVSLYEETCTIIQLFIQKNKYYFALPFLMNLLFGHLSTFY